MPASAPIWRSETPSMPCSAKRRSAASTICSLVDGAITAMPASHHPGQRKSIVLKLRRSAIGNRRRPRGTHRMTRATRDSTPVQVDFDLNGMHTRRASDEALDAVRATGCPVVWTEDNGGHWIVSTYDLVATAFRDWETFSSRTPRPGPLGDRLHQQQPPAVPAGGERPAALVRLPPLARHDPLAAGVGAAPRPRPALDAARARPGGGDGRDRVRPRPHVPGAVVGHARVARVPAGGVAVVLRHLPRHLRVPGRLTRAPGGLAGLRPGAGTHQGGAARPHRVAA